MHGYRPNLTGYENGSYADTAFKVGFADGSEERDYIMPALWNLSGLPKPTCNPIFTPDQRWFEFDMAYQRGYIAGWYQTHKTTHCVKVTCDDGDSWETTIAGNPAEIRRYYMGQWINRGDRFEGDPDRMVQVVRVEFLPALVSV